MNPFEDTAIAARYEQWYAGAGREADILEKALLGKLLGSFPDAISILEVGCGTGHFTRWLGGRLFELVFTAKAENEKCVKQMRSSAGVAVLVSNKSDTAHWIEAGRCYERFALQAAALGIRNAFLNQPVEVAWLRTQFATSLGIGEARPDLVVRFGRGPTQPSSLRRAADAVIV